MALYLCDITKLYIVNGMDYVFIKLYFSEGVFKFVEKIMVIMVFGEKKKRTRP